MLMRFDPFRDFDKLTEQLWNTQANSTRGVAMDAFRRGEQVVVNFDLPGVDPSSIDLTVQRNVLTVSAERRWQTSDDEQVIASERPQGSFGRQLFLGESLDAERVEARYDNGVLTLTIPVAEQAKPRKVEVAVNEKSQAIEAGVSAN